MIDSLKIQDEIINQQKIISQYIQRQNNLLATNSGEGYLWSFNNIQSQLKEEIDMLNNLYL